MKYLLFLVISFAIPFCKNTPKHIDKPIAKVGDKILYESALVNIVKQGTSLKDSVSLVRAYRDKWITKQLLLQHAEMNLTDEQQDVSAQLEEYKHSLLSYIYQQKLVGEKVDTSISTTEIDEYYKKHLSSFMLSKDIVKAMYIKVSLKTPNADLLRVLYRSNKDEDIKAIDSYCFHNAAEYNYYNDDWVFFEDILKKIPLKVEDKSNFLKYNPAIEIKDSLFQYYVNIKEYKLRGDTAPVNMIENDIKNIILIKRKMDFLNELEDNIYKEALNKNEFILY